MEVLLTKITQLEDQLHTLSDIRTSLEEEVEAVNQASEQKSE
jgi:hypothetical protein